MSNLKCLYEKRVSKENTTYLITGRTEEEYKKFNNIQLYDYNIYFLDEFIWLHSYLCYFLLGFIYFKGFYRKLF